MSVLTIPTLVMVLVELYLEAVTAAVHILYGTERGVALAADTDILHNLAVYDEIAGGVFLALGFFDEAFPVVHDNVNRMHP